MSTTEMNAEASAPDDSLNLAALIPEHFARFFEFFKPGHTEGVVSPRIKELARLQIASLNQCDT